MTGFTRVAAGLAGVALLAAATAAPASAEILAIVNYESKPEAPGPRVEGLAVIDVDPASPAFGDIVETIALPADLVAHHLFYDRGQRKLWMTALGKPLLHVIDLATTPYTVRPVPVPACAVGEDVVFSDDNRTWYLTCMGSQNIVVGDVAGERATGVIALPKPYPHGIAIAEHIDRALVTSTVRASDLGDAGETVTELRLSTGEALGTLKVSNAPSPSAAAPVEVVFAPGDGPATAYITNMYGATLWTATWDPARAAFAAAQVFDFQTIGAGVPLEIYFSPDGRTLYVTTAKPGQFHIFDLGAGTPRLTASIDTAEGAHHVAFTRDGRYAVVQNALLNLPGMSDGALVVIDLASRRVAGRIETLKARGLNPNSIVLLPEWNAPAGH